MFHPISTPHWHWLMRNAAIGILQLINVIFLQCWRMLYPSSSIFNLWVYCNYPIFPIKQVNLPNTQWIYVILIEDSTSERTHTKYLWMTSFHRRCVSGSSLFWICYPRSSYSYGAFYRIWCLMMKIGAGAFEYRYAEHTTNCKLIVLHC